LFGVPEVRAMSSMLGRVMKVWPDSMLGSLVCACRVLDGDGDAPAPHIPCAYFDHLRRWALRGHMRL